MKLKNNFSDITRALYSFEHNCWVCGSNDSCELHHILGRVSSSPFNASVLCRKCHEKYTTISKEKLLKKAIKFCISEGYEPNNTDITFYKDNKKLYE